MFAVWRVQQADSDREHGNMLVAYKLKRSTLCTRSSSRLRFQSAACLCTFASLKMVHTQYKKTSLFVMKTFEIYFISFEYVQVDSFTANLSNENTAILAKY